MQLVKKEFINASKLSGREYLVSLLRETLSLQIEGVSFF